jgi:hypothetical protein
MNITTDPWVWLAAFLTLCVFSFLFKDNLLYQFAEHLFVGISAGYLIAITWHNQMYPNLFEPLLFQGQFLYVIPLLFGLAYFARFIPAIGFLVRYPIAFVLGWGSGAIIPAILQRDLFKQTQGTLLVPDAFARWDTGLWAIIIMIGVICTLIYFFFSRERKGILKMGSQVGIVFLMLGFGASFGYTVMSRISLLIGRFQFLLGPWLGITQ